MNNIEQAVLLKLSLDSIIPDPNQPRRTFDQTELRQLAQSIKQTGLLQPIRVRKHPSKAGVHVIVAGERRWRASKLVAGLKTIDALLDDEADQTETCIRTKQLIENIQRARLNPIEEAESFQNLMQLNNWNSKQLAQALSVTEAKVAKSLSLLRLAAPVLEKVNSGQLPASAAYEISNKIKDDPQLQTAVAKKAIQEGLTRDQVKALASRAARMGTLPETKKPKRKPSVQKIGCTVGNVKATFSAPELTFDSLLSSLQAISKACFAARKGGKSVADLSTMIRETQDHSVAASKSLPSANQVKSAAPVKPTNQVKP